MLTLRHARVVDVREGKVRETDVSVDGGRIASLDPSRAAADTVLDLEGAYLLPGLLGCHTHLSIVFPFFETDPNESPATTALRCYRRGMDALAAGVTTVRTVGEKHAADIVLRSMIQKGWVEGPRIVSAARSISTTAGHGSGLGSVIADGADEFLKAARQQFAAGASHVKIFITGGIAHRAETLGEPQATREEMQAAVSVARSKDSYVTAHAGGPGPIRQALEAGVRCFEHGYQLDRATAVAMREAGACLVPTLSVTRSAAWMKANRFEDWTIEKATAAGPDHLDSIRTAIREGVRIVNGTDLPPGDLSDGVSTTVREMEYLVDAGLSPLDSIRATTIRAAELMGLSSDIGAVEPGYAADLVAVRDNPLEDIRALRGMFCVLQAGREVRFEAMKRYRIAVDIGGTFVDALKLDRETDTIRLEKAATTPSAPSEGVTQALAKLGTDLREAEVFVHGTTLGLNAILERKGALTGIITNDGFRDVFEIGRGDVPHAHMYDFRYEKPPALVKRRHRVGIPCRMDVHGAEVEPLDEKALVAAATMLAGDHGIRSLAVCFLHSYKNPAHEQRAAQLLRQSLPGVTVSISSDITREYREYERTSTTVLESYIRPIFEAYVEDLDRALAARGFGGHFLIMRSSGGAMTAEMAKVSPIFTVLSGPAGGVVGAAHLANLLDKPRVISVDFGGTSLDASLIEAGAPSVVHQASLGHHPVLIPIFDIRCIGAGGGSIAWLEDGLLKVGPRSAGAVPGPIAYGKGGTEPTTTDASLVLGYLDPGGFLKGEMALDAAAARAGIATRIADPQHLDLVSASAGIFDVVMARTVGAIREITVERGHDPGEFSLLTFGGAGPLFGPLLAREMGIPEIIVPQAPGAFSAWGMLMSDLAADAARTDVRVLEEADLPALETAFRELEGQAAAALRRQGTADASIRLHRALELRYLGQEHALEVAVESGLDVPEIRRRFEAQHEMRYGHTTGDAIQTVTLRVHGVGLVEKPALRPLAAGDGQPRRAWLTARDAFCFARRTMTPFDVYRRDRLAPGDALQGPAIVDEGTSTTVIHSDQSLRVDAYGHLIITTVMASTA